MVHKWKAVMSAEHIGLKELYPRNGWASITKYMIKLRCENCSATTDWEDVWLGKLVKGRNNRWLGRKMKCPGCERPAEVCVTEFLGVETEDGVLLMQLQANGLQPMDDHIRFYPDMFAIDLDGNVSRKFDLEVCADDRDNGAAALNIEFEETVAYRRAVNSIRVTFERV